jgi:tripeptidyl-peptidase-1
MPVRTAERLLSVEYFNWVNQKTGDEIIRCVAPYYLPEEIAEAVDFVGGTVRFPSYRKLKLAQKVERDYTTINPEEIKIAFNMPGDIAGKSNNNSQAVAQFLGQYYNPSDLTDFQQTFNLSVQAVTQVVGPNNATNPGMEASLDIGK